MQTLVLALHHHRSQLNDKDVKLASALKEVAALKRDLAGTIAESRVSAQVLSSQFA